MTEPTAPEEAIRRMEAALRPVLALGPDFLAGRRDADEMAQTMRQATHELVRERRAQGALGPGASEQARELDAAVAEVHTCGSGYLAGRCDADCVARTMTQVVADFGETAGGVSD